MQENTQTALLLSFSTKALWYAGKYTEDNLPSGPRAAVINKEKLKEVEDVCNPVVSAAYAAAGGAPGGDDDEDEDEIDSVKGERR